MSYLPSRRGLSGVTSQRPGRPVSALGGTQAQNARRAADVSRRLPKWYAAMQGVGSLGDDTLSAADAVANAQWRKDMLDGQRQIAEQLKGDRFQKWVQIGVTASIPVFAAIWRSFGIGRRRAK
jgi:hypothetical protein